MEEKITIDKLVEWEDNPFKRQIITDSELEESIEEFGIKQPLAVIKIGENKYLIVDGNRRFRIALRRGMKIITVAGRF